MPYLEMVEWFLLSCRLLYSRELVLLGAENIFAVHSCLLLIPGSQRPWLLAGSVT